MFHVKHLRSIEEVAGTTRLKPRRNRRPGAQVLPPQPGRSLPAVTCGHAELEIPVPGTSQSRWLEQNVSRETSPVHRRGCGNDPGHASSQPSSWRAGAAGKTGRCFPAVPCDHAESAIPVPGTSQFRWLAQNLPRETSPLRRRGCGIDTRQAYSQPSPVALTQLPEGVGVCQPSLAAMRSWQSPWRGVRSFLDRRRMFNVKHLPSIEEVAVRPASSLVATVAPALVLPPQPVGACLPSLATMKSWKSPCRALRSLVGWSRMFHVKHLRSIEEAVGTTWGTPLRNHRLSH